jgi:2-oxoisovalerate dehydrogenase E2 component (dihydrolipoyl transacylase)
VGSPLITVGESENGSREPLADNVSDSDAATTGVNEGFHEVGVVTQNPTPDREPADEASGNVLIGYGTGAPSPRRQRTGTTSVARTDSSPNTPAPPTEPVQASIPASPAQSQAGSSRAVNGTGATSGSPAVIGPSRTVISPLVRKMARDAGIDLGTLTPTGAAGTIRRSDVERAVAARPGGAPDASVDVAPHSPASDTAEVRRIPITGLRRFIADKMATSRREIPEATVWVDVDATDLLTARCVINRRDPDRPVSILALFSRFAVLGLRTFSELNAHIEGNAIVIPAAVHLGFAAQTERGLVVPVVRNAQDLPARDLSAAIAETASAARTGKLSPQRLSGGTFTVNNYGVFGVDGSAAIINHPEVAILGLGRIIDRPWIIDGKVVARKVAQLSLAFDHRVCDGGVAGGFLRFVADCVEEPVGVLGDL